MANNEDSERSSAFIDIFPTDEIGAVSGLLFSGFLEHLGQSSLLSIYP
jgi:hypothetical protein